MRSAASVEYIFRAAAGERYPIGRRLMMTVNYADVSVLTYWTVTRILRDERFVAVRDQPPVSPRWFSRATPDYSGE